LDPFHPGRRVFESRLADKSTVEGAICVPVVKPEKSSEKTTICPFRTELISTKSIEANDLENSSDFFILYRIFIPKNILAHANLFKIY
jgi:hypothetical protein